MKRSDEHYFAGVAAGTVVPLAGATGVGVVAGVAGAVAGGVVTGALGGVAVAGEGDG
jgi:hypothetical protein